MVVRAGGRLYKVWPWCEEFIRVKTVSAYRPSDSERQGVDVRWELDGETSVARWTSESVKQ